MDGLSDISCLSTVSTRSCRGRQGNGILRFGSHRFRSLAHHKPQQISRLVRGHSALVVHSLVTRQYSPMARRDDHRLRLGNRNVHRRNHSGHTSVFTITPFPGARSCQFLYPLCRMETLALLLRRIFWFVHSDMDDKWILHYDSWTLEPRSRSHGDRNPSICRRRSFDRARGLAAQLESRSARMEYSASTDWPAK